MVNLRISENELGYLRLLIDIISAEENESQLDSDSEMAELKEDVVN